MADKRLDQENVLSDFDYALIVKGNDVAKISSADLASIVGGLMDIRSVANKQRMPKMCTISNSGNFVFQTDVRVGGTVLSAEYHIAYNTDAGDKTYFENGVLRFGYDNGTIEKHILKDRPGGVTLNFSINARTNTVEIRPSANVSLRGYLIYT